MKYELLVFDWDGTLADTSWRIVACFQAAATDINQTPPEPEAVRQCIGLDLPHTIKKLYPDMPSVQCCALQDRYWKHFYSEDIPSVSFFEGVYDGLKELKQKGFILTVATGKSRNGLEKDLVDTQSKEFFAATMTVDEAPSKPNPQMLLNLMEQLGATPEQTVMIGDSVYDLEMAQDARVDAVGVSYGNQSVDQLERYTPKIIVNSFVELVHYFKQN